MHKFFAKLFIFPEFSGKFLFVKTWCSQQQHLKKANFNSSLSISDYCHNILLIHWCYMILHTVFPMFLNLLARPFWEKTPQGPSQVWLGKVWVILFHISSYHKSASLCPLKVYTAMSWPGSAAVSFYALASQLTYDVSAHCEYAPM